MVSPFGGNLGIPFLLREISTCISLRDARFQGKRTMGCEKERGQAFGCGCGEARDSRPDFGPSAPISATAQNQAWPLRGRLQPQPSSCTMLWRSSSASALLCALPTLVSLLAFGNSAAAAPIATAGLSLTAGDWDKNIKHGTWSVYASQLGAGGTGGRETGEEASAWTSGRTDTRR